MTDPDYPYESACQAPDVEDLAARAEFTAWAADFHADVDWIRSSDTADVIVIDPPDIASSRFEVLPGQWVVRRWRDRRPTDGADGGDVRWIVADSWPNDFQRMQLDDFRRSITNHTPTAAGIAAIHEVRTAAMTFAKATVLAVDTSGDRAYGHTGSARAQDVALERIEEAVMWAVKAIVLASGEPTDGVPRP